LGVVNTASLELLFRPLIRGQKLEIWNGTDKK
jgi:hypothetical protein